MIFRKSKCDRCDILKIILLMVWCISNLAMQVWYTWRNRRLPSPPQINSSVCLSVRSLISLLIFLRKSPRANRFGEIFFENRKLTGNRESGIFQNGFACDDSRKNRVIHIPYCSLASATTTLTPLPLTPPPPTYHNSYLPDSIRIITISTTVTM